MFCVRIDLTTGWRPAVSVLMLASAVVSASPAAAARHHHRHGPASTVDYNPPFASIVVDTNSGKVLQETNADSSRHPASLTKIMTLYLLFERLQGGKLKLDTQLKVSEHAASQAPTKLGLDAGDSIAVEDAIRAVVTKSANDMAVVIAEAIGGSEEEFARMMTVKAHSLGMTHTEYHNASGLPDDDQITTARDLALLSRAIQERFPQYYHFFSTPSFTYHGDSMRNHNHLLGSLEGVDGIKTGYTEASGFNLAASIKRGNRRLVAVILGGRSGGARDAKMRELLESGIAHASDRHTAPVIAENAEPGDHKPRTFAVAAANGEPPQGSSDPIKPILVKTIPFKTSAPSRPASVEPAAPPLAPAKTQVVVTRPNPDAQPIINPEPGVLGVLPASIVAQPFVPQPPAASASQSSATQQVIGPPPASLVASNSLPPATATTARAPAAPTTQTAEAFSGALAASAEQAKPAHTGWIVQVGALEDEGEAKARISLAQTKSHALAHAEAFTETVVKGDKTLYRARFAGFVDKDQAEAVCKSLKHTEVPCMTLKN
jgi:D-alanyl-D-alanine carboxypeptidase